MMLTSKCYYEISKALEKSGKGVIFSLEGGYNLEALAESVHASIAPFYDLDMEFAEPAFADETVTRYIDSKLNAVKKTLREHWSI